MTAVSAIIPTYNRAEMLRGVLETLETQNAQEGLFEVVVVDDGSGDTTPDVLKTFADRLPLRSVHQQNSGLNVARNTGADAARGRILAFLDDDVLLHPGWAREVAAAFDAFPGAQAAAGRIRLRFESPPPPWLTERFHSYLSAFDAGPEPRWLPGEQFPPGANAIVLRSEWERLGGFVPDLDRRGDSLISSGDKEFFLRLRASGSRIAWWPAAWVLHRVHPDRLSRDWFRRRAYAQGLGDGIMEARDEAPRVTTVAREVLRAGRAAPILARNVTLGRGTLPADLWLRFCAGRIRGLARADGTRRTA